MEGRKEGEKIDRIRMVLAMLFALCLLWLGARGSHYQRYTRYAHAPAGATRGARWRWWVGGFRVDGGG